MSVLLRYGPLHAMSALRGALGLRGVGLAIGSAALAMAGCSANIARFDNPSFALGEGANAGGGTASRRTAGGPVLEPYQPYQPVQPAARGGGPEVAGLPTIEDTSAASGHVPPVRALAVQRAVAPVQAVPAAASVGRGQQIEVQQGDTLYAIGKRHNVMIADLMAVNELKSPSLKPGQKLYLPAAGGRATPQVRPERTAAVKPVAVAAPVAAAQPAPHVQAAAGSETYTVRQGDSLYAIAAKHKIKVLDLQRANEITDARKVKPGMVLKVPAVGQAVAVAGPSAAAAPVVAGETVQPEARIVRVGTAPVAAAPAGVKVLNGGDVPPASANDASPGAAGGKLRWPAKGRVVQAFGPRADGTHNDGVDIAVPAGTDVLAAENGVVAYAGNEVKTYGNLVLIRHDNGWVTAYAHSDELKVKRAEAQLKFDELKAAGSDKWVSFRAGVERAWNEFETAVKKLTK